ncbi:MAG: DNA-processing protein DprA [Acidobacteriota bacterium]
MTDATTPHAPAGPTEGACGNPKSRPPQLRDLLLALYSTDQLPRSAALRLARSAELWSGLAATGTSSPPSAENQPDPEDPDPENPVPENAGPGNAGPGNAGPGNLVLLDEELLDKEPLEESLVQRGRRLIPQAHRHALAAQQRARRGGGRLITRLDPDYPESLRRLYDPPSVLAVRGSLPSHPAVALVGSRKASREARDLSRQLAQDLAASGWVVVSGFAMGIDLAAHSGALQSPGGRTVAVLGCGLGHPYPQAHWDLAQEISRSGAVISELAWGDPPRRWTFPARNRLIAALCRGVVVVRAGERSGALITARHALDLGLEVMAVPGSPRDPLSAGCHQLLRDGATLVTDADQVLEALTGFRPASSLPIPFPTSPATTALPSLPPDDEGAAGQLLQSLATHGVASLDLLVEESHQEAGKVLAHLAELEILGAVRRLPGPSWERVAPRGR